MRHKKKNKHFGRKSQHRRLMFFNMCTSIILNERIVTTLQKAKEVRRFLEPLITLSKVDSVHNRRLAFSKLNNKKSVGILFNSLSGRFVDRPGGYLRIMKCGYRKGDAAKMGVVELV